jgi:hypothetical protein
LLFLLLAGCIAYECIEISIAFIRVNSEWLESYDSSRMWIQIEKLGHRMRWIVKLVVFNLLAHLVLFVSLIPKRKPIESP